MFTSSCLPVKSRISFNAIVVNPWNVGPVVEPYNIRQQHVGNTSKINNRYSYLRNSSSSVLPPPHTDGGAYRIDTMARQQQKTTKSSVTQNWLVMAGRKLGIPISASPFFEWCGGMHEESRAKARDCSRCSMAQPTTSEMELKFKRAVQPCKASVV